MKKKTILDYKRLLYQKSLLEEYNLWGMGNQEISTVSYNSKEVDTGGLFICKGNNFKPEYLREALNKGAIAYVTDKKEHILSEEVPFLIVNDLRHAINEISKLYFDSSWNEGLTMVGITGTKGKSTVACMLEAVIDDYMDKTCNVRCGFSSGIYTFDGKKRKPSHITTPEIIELHQLLDQCVNNGCKYFVMEVSSQGLKYNRVSSLRYRIGAFLNISQDHISDVEHKSMEDYFSSKLKIFALCEKALVNLDIEEPYLKRILDYANKNAKETVTFGKNENANYIIKFVEETPEKIHVIIEHEGIRREITANISGEYNAYNVACTYAAANELGIPFESVKDALSSIRIPGRMEHYKLRDDVEVIVDYAHNMLSYEALFKYAKSQYPKRNIGFMFGCVGDKAFNRRKEGAKCSDLYADFSVITEIYPGNERAEDICLEIYENMEHKEKAQIEPDRDRAVDMILAKAMDIGNCVVLLCGAGSDIYERGGKNTGKGISDGTRIKNFIQKIK